MVDVVAARSAVADARTEGAPGLRLRDVVVEYEAASRRDAPVRAVDEVSLDLPHGQVLALLGPSGCGKSSLLRAVAGLERSTGEISWGGRSLAGLPVHERGIGLMFQDGQLFPHRDVAGNVAYGLEGRALRGGRRERVPVARRRARVAELLDAVGLAGYETRQVSTLSGGERQRVALARSLAPAPGLLLLDEPLSALDRELRERLAVDLRVALLATGTTAVFVTHDQDEAFTVADRVAVMSRGAVLQEGTPAHLWAAPADRTVASFLGYEVFVTVDGASLAVPPGGFRLLGLGSDGLDGPDGAERDVALLRRGVVTGVPFRRGAASALVEIDGLGTVTVHEAATGARALESLDVGDVVQLRLTLGRCAPCA
ncbi:ABC transporter ATP-binding protein [Sanguibacter hominis ATCC BAA-789]|uniref:ABC-type quaternary amine transporter n=1 Tax=Sanguibacter hominis ATCC BAA-789 TaxID=1312740 RepID=A0A9X5FCI5_9MICO|nr:ABC transporter ATP-binding protein [Sanguibacter hominis]NKX92547.1 ABC transporter ATP-binding protein [Sanguibacter hominis ATCC BAA-789]